MLLYINPREKNKQYSISSLIIYLFSFYLFVDLFFTCFKFNFESWLSKLLKNVFGIGVANLLNLIANLVELWFKELFISGKRTKTETLQPSLGSSSCFIRIYFLNLICFYEKFQKGKQNFSTVECNHVEMLLSAYYDHIS